MKTLALPLVIIALMHTRAMAEELDDSTLTCVSVRDRFNHGAIPERSDFRGMKLLYITKKNMFTQSATKNMETGEIMGGGASSMGAVFEWNKIKSGNAGLRVKFKGFATRGAGKISYELEYTVKNTLADNVNMTVAEKGEIYRDANGWQMFSESKQSLPGGRQAAIYNQQSWFKCELEQGRHLL